MIKKKRTQQRRWLASPMSEAAGTAQPQSARVGGTIIPVSFLVTIAVALVAVACQYLVCVAFWRLHRREDDGTAASSSDDPGRDPEPLAREGPMHATTTLSKQPSVDGFLAPAPAPLPPYSAPPPTRASTEEAAASKADAGGGTMQQGAAGEQREDGPSRALRTLSVTIGDSISESFTWLRERVKPAIPRNSSSSVLDFAGAISSASVSEDGAPRSTQSKERPPNARRSGKRTSDGTESRSKVNDGEPRQMRDSSDLQVRRKKKKKRHSRDEHEEAGGTHGASHSSSTTSSNPGNGGTVAPSVAVLSALEEGRHFGACFGDDARSESMCTHPPHTQHAKGSRRSRAAGATSAGEADINTSQHV